MHCFRIFHTLLLSALALGTVPAHAAPLDCGGMMMPVSGVRGDGRGFSRYHGGVDLMAPYGAPIRAAASGEVIWAARYYAYGNMVDIRHGDGTVTRYAHLSRFAQGLKPGKRVAIGEIIGAVGTTGNAHGAHLHFEVRVNGSAIDPRPMIEPAACLTTQRPSPVLQVRSTTPRSTAPVDARPGGLLD
jgi:murein DD-endopeptidase MepM/ murein hydrolase activator NlpD